MYKWTKMIDVPNDLPQYDRAQFQIGTDIYLIGGNGYFLGNWNDSEQVKPITYSTTCYKFDCLTETFASAAPIPDGAGHGQMFGFSIPAPTPSRYLTTDFNSLIDWIIDNHSGGTVESSGGYLHILPADLGGAPGSNYSMISYGYITLNGIFTIETSILFKTLGENPNGFFEFYVTGTNNSTPYLQFNKSGIIYGAPGGGIYLPGSRPLTDDTEYQIRIVCDFPNAKATFFIQGGSWTNWTNIGNNLDITTSPVNENSKIYYTGYRNSGDTIGEFFVNYCYLSIGAFDNPTSYGYVGGGLINTISEVTNSAYAISNYPLGYMTDFPKEYAFDKDTNTFWHSAQPDGSGGNGGEPWWIGQDFGVGNEQCIISYSITNRPDGNFQSPEEFTFEASDTGAWGGEEVILDTQIGYSGWQIGETKTFNFDNSISYRYYRLNVSKVNTTNSLNYCAISELKMYANDYGVSDKVWQYNPLTDTWTELNPFGGGERRGATAFAINGKGYVSNGARLWELPNDGMQVSWHVHYAWDVWEYDPTGDTWTDKTLTMNYSGAADVEAYMRGTNRTTQANTGERGRAYVVESYPVETEVTNSAYAISNYPLGWNSVYSMQQAFDKITTGENYWHTSNPDGSMFGPGGEPWWIGQDFGEGNEKCIIKYSIQARDYMGSVHNPATFTFEASHTGVWGGEQIILDTQTNLTWTIGELKTFTINNKNSYRFYRINITQSDTWETSNYLNITEISMYVNVETPVTNPYAVIHGGLIRGSNGDLYPVAGCWSYHPDTNTTLWEGYWQSGSREGYWNEAFVKMENKLLFASLRATDSVNMYFPHYILGANEAEGVEYLPWLPIEQGQYSFASPNAWNHGDDAYILDVGYIYKYSYISNVPYSYQMMQRRNR